MGRMIAAVTMFAAIGFLWTFVGLVGSMLVTRRYREVVKRQGTVANETKELIKNKIDSIERLGEAEIEDLIKLIRTLDTSSQIIDRASTETVEMEEKLKRMKSKNAGISNFT